TNGAPGTWFGRAVYARAQFAAHTIRFDDCEFVGNNAGTGMGGAVYAEDTRIEFLKCRVELCGGGQAGACVALRTDFTMHGCTLVNNSTGATGGNAWLEDGTTRLFDCTVDDGFSSYCGAGFAVTGGSLWVTGSRFSGNSSTCGGALFLSAVSTTIDGSEFAGNLSADFESGGAILQIDGQLDVNGCLFQGNVGGQGGAIAAFSTQTQNGLPDPNVWTHLQDSECIDNRAEAMKHVHEARGGAIYASTLVEVSGCDFEHNRVEWLEGPVPGTGAFGGALYLIEPASIAHSSFVGNGARADSAASGGAIHAQGPVDLERCILFSNRVEQALNADGGALFGEIHALHCTLRGNSCASGGNSVAQAGSLTHCIVWENPAPRLDLAVTAQFSLVEGGAAGAGNVDADPLFWGSDDHHLMPDSPAIDAGDPNLAGDGDGTLADLGALPFDPEHCGPGCTGWLGSNSCLAFPNSTGGISTLIGLGSDLAQENLLILHAAHLPAGMPGYFLASQGTTYVPGFGGSSGVLCVGPPMLLRFHAEVRWSGPSGQITQRLDLSNFPQDRVVFPGDTWYFQLWHRDYSGVDPTSNTTPALRVDFR
ncbi:MAG: hypothetical protein KDB61_06675, partial [Planctomycetes bacterium]|nr:hypothetical protein [Planctomycetota bacterium]